MRSNRKKPRAAPFGEGRTVASKQGLPARELQAFDAAFVKGRAPGLSRPLPPRRLPLFEEPPDLVEEHRAVAVELVAAHPVDAAELALGPRLESGHLGQGDVAEDDEGRHPFLVGELCARLAADKAGVVVDLRFRRAALDEALAEVALMRGTAMASVFSPLSSGPAASVSLSTE